jgi:hypothetical protein
MSADDLVDRELMLSRFQRLIGELLSGNVRRTVFYPWEIELLLDIQDYPMDANRRIGALRRYARAVTRQLETGPGPPMKFSDYVQRSSTRRPSSE